MAADNDLEPYAWLDMYEMEAAYTDPSISSASSDVTDVIVQIDSQSLARAQRYHIEPSSYLYRNRSLHEAQYLAEHGIESPIVEELPRIDSADPTELSAFLKWSVKKYPAHHYLVVIWGHAQGWKSTRHGFGGIAEDHSAKTQMSIPDLSKALALGAQTAGQNWDLLVTDTCLMQTLEVATHVSGDSRQTPTPLTRFIVGSTEVMSRVGLPYRRLIQELNSKSFLGEGARQQSSDEPWLLARILPRLGVSSFDPAQGIPRDVDPRSLESYTLSTLASDELRRSLLPALRTLNASLLTAIEHHPGISFSIQRAIAELPSYIGGTRDLGGILVALKSVQRSEPYSEEMNSLGVALEQALEALDRTVISTAFGNRLSGRGLESLGFKALAVWAPTNAPEFKLRMTDFQQVQRGWGEWIGAMNRVLPSPPSPKR